jgi:hypothetical protein
MVSAGVETMQACAALSAAMSLAVMASILHKRLFGKVFLKLIFYVSFCDFWTSFALMFGGTRSGSPACYTQGLVTNVFGLASFLWSAAIAYQVQLVVFEGRVQHDLRWSKAICWGLSLMASLLPLSTMSYGNDDATPGWCFLDLQPGYPQWVLPFWFIASYYLWLLLVIAFLFFVVARVGHKVFVAHGGLNRDAAMVVRRIIVFPCVVALCWTAASVQDLSSSFGLQTILAPNDEAYVAFNYALPTLQGCLSSLAFFAVNHDLLTDVESPLPPAKSEAYNSHTHSSSSSGSRFSAIQLSFVSNKSMYRPNTSIFSARAGGHNASNHFDHGHNSNNNHGSDSKNDPLNSSGHGHPTPPSISERSPLHTITEDRELVSVPGLVPAATTTVTESRAASALNNDCMRSSSDSSTTKELSVNRTSCMQVNENNDDDEEQQLSRQGLSESLVSATRSSLLWCDADGDSIW